MVLRAVPSAGYVFSGWTGDATGTDNPLSIMMTAHKTITANFAASDARCSIAATLLPSDAAGMVEFSPAQGEDGYPINTVVDIEAVANAGYKFNRWEGALTGGIPTGTLRLDTSKSLTAVFDPYFVLSTAVDSPGQGSITLDPQPTPDGYLQGTSVTISAVPAKGYKFDHWSGAATGSTNPITVTMSSAQDLTAHFIKPAPFPWIWVLVAIVGLVVAIPFVSIVLRKMM